MVDIKGRERVEGVTIAEVDEKGKPIQGTEEFYPCDTLLLSVGLIPENELSRGMGVDINPVTSGPRVNESLETNIDGVFACGNVLHVHDLVDYVSEEAAAAGKNAASYVKGENAEKDVTKKDMAKKNMGRDVILKPASGVRYTVPEKIRVSCMEENLTVRFRVGSVYKNCYVRVDFDGEKVINKKRQIVAPGEMEEIKLTKDQLLQYPDLKTITVMIEGV